MHNYIMYFMLLVLSLFISLLLIPILKLIAIKVGLVDKPNARKVHANSVPLVGGIAIFLSSILTLSCSDIFWISIKEHSMLLSGGGLLLLVGIIDDKMDINAMVKLMVQIALAYFAFQKGIRIDSFYGVFGIYTLPIAVQFILTLVVITGVINAFNLMDGIDGLAAGLAIVAVGTFACLAFVLNNAFLVALYLVLIGGLIGFLRYNLSQDVKVFMGDAGSLFLGYILVVSGIMLINQSQETAYSTMTVATVIGVLALPVADSIRVYRRRIKTGYSPFKADRTHIHHLVLMLGLKHQHASFVIVAFSMLMVVLCIVLSVKMNVSWAILCVLFIFILAATLLRLNSDVKKWRQRLRKLEDN